MVRTKIHKSTSCELWRPLQNLLQMTLTICKQRKNTQLLLRCIRKHRVRTRVSGSPAKSAAVRKRYIFEVIIFGTSSNPSKSATLGVQLHHHFASNLLMQSLNCLGLCCSYAEVQKYERAAANTLSVDIPGFASGHFVQFVAGNVDHNSRTLDGMNTFHGMGIIAAVSPGIKTCTPIHRVTVLKT